jgi:cbb3-type cytochrome oxidase cytochrome c subunit
MKETNSVNNPESMMPIYDTIAKDSFSAGAVSMDVARRIRMSSQKYQDSLRKAREKLEEEKLAKKLKEEKEKTDKKALEEKIKIEKDRIESEKSDIQ